MTIQEISFTNFTDAQYEHKLNECIDLILLRNNLNSDNYSLHKPTENSVLSINNLIYSVEVKIFDFLKERKISQLECYKSLKNDYYEFNQSFFI